MLHRLQCDKYSLWDTLLVLFVFILLDEDKEISPILCIFAGRLNEKIKNKKPNLAIKNLTVLRQFMNSFDFNC